MSLPTRFTPHVLWCACFLAWFCTADAIGQTQKSKKKKASAPAISDALPRGALMRMGSSRLAHGNWLTSVSFSADDRYLGTADSDGVVRLWETATGKLVWEKPK